MDLTALPAVVDHNACDPDEVAEIMAALANPSRPEIVRGRAARHWGAFQVLVIDKDAQP